MLRALQRGWRRIGEIKHLTRILSIVSGTLVTIAAGLACLQYRFAEPVIRWSYDVPFLWRSRLDTPEITLVYLDEYSAKQLNQPLANVWDRALHPLLLDRLTADGARLVFYDIVFDAPAEDPAADAAFGDAIKRNGKVVLGAALDIVERLGAGAQVSQERISAPIPPLRRSAAGWGLLAFRPVDADYGVRQIYTGTSRIPTSTWKSAELLGAPVTREPREGAVQRWVNYYGPRDTFASVNIAQALDPEGVPAGFFKDRIVMIGGRSVIGALQVGRDEFATPYKEQFTPGVEVHATVLLNLLRGEWLTRWQPRWEMIAIILVGCLAGALSLLRPTLVLFATALLSLAIAAAALWSVWNQRLWWPWLIPAGIQMPLGLVWSVGSQYLLESRRRKELRRAFGFYLSPEMADRIADSDFDLRPGGRLVEVSVIFTDLENFTTLSEKLDPKEVSEILTTYFGQTTKWILDNRGTIIKYIGDAVFAAWGAPIDEPEHALRAAEAACDLRRLTELEIHGKKLRTRIGIHSGRVLAGNLGSEYRFDYTMIGDAVNFASRLESLNKYLSTQVLISDAVYQQLGDKFTTRRLGEFRVAGKTDSVKIHELLCRREMQDGEPKWIQVFEEGLSVFREGKFAEARKLMERTPEVRGSADGPSEFYLRKISKLEANGALEDWNGIVELTEK